MHRKYVYWCLTVAALSLAAAFAVHGDAHRAAAQATTSCTSSSTTSGATCSSTPANGANGTYTDCAAGDAKCKGTPDCVYEGKFSDVQADPSGKGGTAVFTPSKATGSKCDWKPDGKTGHEFNWTAFSAARACPRLAGRVPQVVIDEALANPESVMGWAQLANPNTRFHPLFNPTSFSLNLANPSIPFDSRHNPLVYRAGCR